MALRPAGRSGKNLDAVDENANLGTPPLNAAASTVASAASPLQKKDARAVVAKVRMRRKTTKGFDRGPTLD